MKLTKCIEYSGYKNERGYGRIYFSEKSHAAHRVAWSLANGRQPKRGMDICHKCDNPSCINPAHLFEGTRSDNMKDALEKGRNKNASKTHCVNGHSLDNAYINPNTGKRKCRKCSSKWDKEYTERNLEKQRNRWREYQRERAR